MLNKRNFVILQVTWDGWHVIRCHSA